MYKEELREMWKRMDARRVFLEKELETVPRGRLASQKRKDGVAMLQEIRAKGVRHRFVVTKEAAVVRGLIRKELFEKELSQLKENMRILRVSIGKMTEREPGENVKCLKERIPGLKEELITEALAEEGDEWSREAYEQSAFRPEERTHITSRGLAVRSKSEAAIAEMLYRYGVAFRYEQIIKISRRTFTPDFTIRRADGKILIWEHFGMMANPEYARKQFEKEKAYAAAGIVPWDNLILTYDDADGNIDLRWVRAVIEARIVA